MTTRCLIAVWSRSSRQRTARVDVELLFCAWMFLCRIVLNWRCFVERSWRYRYFTSTCKTCWWCTVGAAVNRHRALWGRPMCVGLLSGDVPSGPVRSSRPCRHVTSRRVDRYFCTVSDLCRCMASLDRPSKYFIKSRWAGDRPAAVRVAPAVDASSVVSIVSQTDGRRLAGWPAGNRKSAM